MTNPRFWALLPLCLLLSLASMAQDGMRMGKFELLPGDDTARRPNTMRTDQNGETAALIKIVSPGLQSLTFDGGSLGIVATEVVGSEWWVYVPGYAQRLTVSHPVYGVLRMEYPLTIESGCVYRLLLDVGIGRYITISASQPDAEIEIDGEPVGRAPVADRYLLFGPHVVKAVNGRYEGTDTLMLSGISQTLEQEVTVQMHESSAHFGRVVVTASDDADICFDGQRVATGRWETELREGSYELETRREGCDPATTYFTVKAQQDNLVQAVAPTPYRGWLSIYTRPRQVEATCNGQSIDLSQPCSLPVGSYQVTISHKSYDPVVKDYTVQHNQTTTDTLTLRKKILTLCYGGGLFVNHGFGANVMISFLYKNLDFSLTMESTFKNSDNKNASDKSSSDIRSYSMGAYIGPRLKITDRLAFTPQAGIIRNSAYSDEGILADDSDSYVGLGLNAKLTYHSKKRWQFYVMPTYRTSHTFSSSTSSGEPLKVGGLGVSAGVCILIHFKSKKL